MNKIFIFQQYMLMFTLGIPLWQGKLMHIFTGNWAIVTLHLSQAKQLTFAKILFFFINLIIEASDFFPLYQQDILINTRIGSNHPDSPSRFNWESWLVGQSSSHRQRNTFFFLLQTSGQFYDQNYSTNSDSFHTHFTLEASLFSSSIIVISSPAILATKFYRSPFIPQLTL